MVNTYTIFYTFIYLIFLTFILSYMLRVWESRSFEPVTLYPYGSIDNKADLDFDFASPSFSAVPQDKKDSREGLKHPFQLLKRHISLHASPTPRHLCWLNSNNPSLCAGWEPYKMNKHVTINQQLLVWCFGKHQYCRHQVCAFRDVWIEVILFKQQLRLMQSIVT